MSSKLNLIPLTPEALQDVARMMVTGDGLDDGMWARDEGYDGLEAWGQRVIPSTHGLFVMFHNARPPRWDIVDGIAFSLDVGRDWLIKQLQEQTQ